MRDEASNWLDASLSWTGNFLDELFVYDDQSSDDSMNVALKHTPFVVRRSDDETSFMEHEGKFRQNAWKHMTEALDPDPSDWILTFDADEFLVGGFDQKIRDRLERLIVIAQDVNRDCVNIARPEVWQHDIKLLVRTDGFWMGASPRLANWKPGSKFKNKKIGCGSLPEMYVDPLSTVHLVSLLHLGYSTPEDRQRHYSRYMGLKNHGHSQKHIDSILSTPELMEFEGPAPKIWRGKR